MTQDEIIRMAREAGLDLRGKGWIADDAGYPCLERFAALVAEATKEKAAKVCEELHLIWDAKGANEQCAAAIRSMK
jgi:hypothetical protein